jgi:hypothetical protein
VYLIGVDFVGCMLCLVLKAKSYFPMSYPHQLISSPLLRACMYNSKCAGLVERIHKWM